MRADHTHLSKIINILFKLFLLHNHYFKFCVLVWIFTAFMLTGLYDVCGCVDV